MSEKGLRTYGKPPFNVVVLHGGPGASGHMAPVARALSPDWGVLEPFQKAKSVEGQVQELRDVLESHSRPPVTLIGWSWGAMLGYIFSAHYSGLVRKLILVGSAVYEDKFAARIQETRLNRLDAEERREVHSLADVLKGPATDNKSTALARLGRLFVKADAYDPITLDMENLEVCYDVHQSVWDDVVKLRKSGELLKLGRQIRCPVVAVHGDYDPHPYQGIEKSLVPVVQDFKFILLENCGHAPWIERETKKKFYGILREELDIS